MNCKKSTLQVFSGNAQEVYSEGLVEFPNVAVKTGCNIKNLTNTTIQLAAGGLYKIDVNASACAIDESGDVVIQLFKNGIPMPSAISRATTEPKEDTEALSFSCLLLINPSCCAVDNTTTINVVNTGVDAIFEDASVTIVKLA